MHMSARTRIASAGGPRHAKPHAAHLSRSDQALLSGASSLQKVVIEQSFKSFQGIILVFHSYLWYAWDVFHSGNFNINSKISTGAAFK